jgi:hypothetical protein
LDFLPVAVTPLVPVPSKHILGANLLVSLFVLSLNHQNPHLGFIALTISPFLVVDAKTYMVKKDKNLKWQSSFEQLYVDGSP